METVVGFIGKLVEDTIPKRTTREFPNQKPWLDSGVRSLLRARGAAFKSGDRLAYSHSRRELKRGISEAKRKYQQHIEGHFKTSDSRSMWRGIKAITDYKGSAPPTSRDATLPDALNTFFTRFDIPSTGVPAFPIAPTNQMPTRVLQQHQARSMMKKINITKAAGPDGVPGRVLKACADQLVGVFTDIFNRSLQQAVVPTCLKSTTIVPMPKKQAVKCLNDYRPVALTPIIMKCFERLVLHYIKDIIPADLDIHQLLIGQTDQRKTPSQLPAHGPDPPGGPQHLC